MFTGGCNCRAIRYQIIAEPLFVHICHCRECQRDSGGAFNMTMLVLEKDFQLSRGKPAQRITTRKSGKQYYGYYCDQCGSPLCGMPVASGAVMVLRPGSLDDTAWVKPQAHIWTREKQNWLALGEGIPSFEREYDLYDLWPEASLARLPGSNAS